MREEPQHVEKKKKKIKHKLVAFAAAVCIANGSLSPHKTGAKLRAKCGLVSSAVYFPQYHRDINNDIFWGNGFTEWSHLENLTHDAAAKHKLRTPLQQYELNLKTLQKHAKLASKYGLGAFIFYSYWFEHGRRVLARPLESLLPHTPLGINFALSWANEPWTRRWDGMQGEDTLVKQTYGSSFDWAKHYATLSPYFNHPDYLKIDGKPVFFIYNVPHIAERRKGDGVAEGDCSEESTQNYGPGGEPAARIYQNWYTDVKLQLNEMYTHWQKLGKKEGRTWPILACTESTDDRAVRQAIERQVDESFQYEPTTFDRMMHFFQLYAKRSGFPGLYVVATMGSFLRPSEFDEVVRTSAQAAAQFLPMNLDAELLEVGKRCGCHEARSQWSHNPQCPPTCTCLMRELINDVISRPSLLPKSVIDGERAYFRGAFSSWSNYPRHTNAPEGSTAFCSNPDYNMFGALLRRQISLSMQSMCRRPMEKSEVNSILLVNAWNEWGEQAVLEPNSVDGFAALRAVRDAITSIERGI